MNKRDQKLWEQALHDGERFDSAESCFADLIRADEREEITSEWYSVVQGDLENGVACLNREAALKWRKEYPSMADFGEWLEARGNK